MIKALRLRSLIALTLSLFLSAGTYSSGAEVGQRTMRLHYDRPGSVWMTQGLPIGNGVQGAMFMGGYRQERIQFNDKTLWTGSPSIRGAYQNFGDLFIDLHHTPNYEGYERSLDIDNAIGRVAYTTDGVRYEREYIASHPDQVIALRLTANKPSSLSLSLRLQDGRAGQHTPEISKRDIGITSVASYYFSGKLDLVSYMAGMRILPQGGRMEVNDKAQSIDIRDADAVTIYLLPQTNYDIHADSYIRGDLNAIRKRIDQTLDKAVSKGFDSIKSDHVRDYHRLYSRVKLNLHADQPNTPPTITTDELVRRQSGNTYLDELYFQYGRYLMIASSRGIDLPNNLQGLWNNSNTPPWESDIHTNINIQMNYWPSEPTNLSECHLPFINYVVAEASKSHGGMQQTAKNEGLRGWSLHTQSNIFSHTDWNINRPCNAWYAMHLWQHYLYTQDKIYLSRIRPTLQSACEYWFDRLKQDDRGLWIAPEEWSPEHGPWEDGIAYAQQLIWELFDSTLKASHIVRFPAPFVKELKAKFTKLDRGLTIGSWGQIREWTIKEDTQGDEHRHLSHLIALYPGGQISPLTTPTLAEAARISMRSRGDNGTGWSRAWKIALWARLGDGNRAHHLLKQALHYTTITGNSMDVRDGGVYENLLDAHPPFQIDGNFGATAGVAEMLIQSHLDFIHLLPALPQAWQTGQVEGLRASGNFTLSMAWMHGKLMKGSIRSGSGLPCKLLINDAHNYIIRRADGRAIKTKYTKDGYISFDTQRGMLYVIARK